MAHTLSLPVAKLHEAGYVLREFSLSDASMKWRLPSGEVVKTTPIDCERVGESNLWAAPIDRVMQAIR